MEDDILSDDEEEPPPKRYRRSKSPLRCFGGIWYRLHTIAPDSVDAQKTKDAIIKGPGEHIRVVKENDYFLVYHGDEYMFKPRPKKWSH